MYEFTNHRAKEKPRFRGFSDAFGARNETRTRDPNLGKVVLYQLSYSRFYVDFSIVVQKYAKLLNSSSGIEKKIKKRQSCKPGSVPKLPWASIIDLGCNSRYISIGLPSWLAEAIERVALCSRFI